MVQDPTKNGHKELKEIERIARTCYKSEDKITEDGSSAKQLIYNLIANGHEAMLEHSSLSVKFVCSRSVSHELVRHRMASFAQESQRYCNYSKDKFGAEVTFIKPIWYGEGTPASFAFEEQMKAAEETYFKLLNDGLQPQEAREVLPNATKTEVVITANYREWRHILKLRTDAAAHPEMRRLMRPLLDHLKFAIPVVFDDIKY